MLKKLLASALAVATVATCAYVPSALASAGTTYKTADDMAYFTWTLENEAPEAEKAAITVYFAGNDTQNLYVKDATDNAFVLDVDHQISGSYGFSLEVKDNTVENVQAEVEKLGCGVVVKNMSGTIAPRALKDDKDTDLVKHEVTVYAVGQTTYIAQIDHQEAVVYSEYDEKATDNAAAITDTKPATLNAADVKLLNYYPITAAGTVDKSAVFAEMYSKNLAGRLASQAFDTWYLDVEIANIVVPKFTQAVDSAKLHYSDVDLYVAESATYKGSALVNGGYYKAMVDADETPVNLLLPDNDKSNWTTYLVNYVKENALVQDGFTDHDTDAEGKDVNVPYVFNTVRAVGTDAVTGNRQYAVTYVKKSASDKVETGKYNLKLIPNGATTNEAVLDVTGYVGFVKNGTSFTTDPAEIYALLKSDDVIVDNNRNYDYTINVGADIFNAKDTLADWLVAGKDTETTIYALTDNYQTKTVYKDFKLTDDPTDADDATYKADVIVEVFVEPSDLYKVYSFGMGNVVNEKKVYVSKSLMETTAYMNMDLNANLSKENQVLKATAADLGIVDVNATIDDVPAVYAYAQQVENEKMIYTTYKLGDATINLDDFTTTTDKFDDVAYFGKKGAEVGDKVLLKVSLSATGEAKELDVKEIEVKWNNIAGVTDVALYGVDGYYEDGTYKPGEASWITLGEGTNIVTATVYYKGVEIGTFKPFYANV